MPSIKVTNETEENLRISIFKYQQVPMPEMMAWNAAALPRDGGNKVFVFSEEYSLYISHLDPASSVGVVKTHPVVVPSNGAKLIAEQEYLNDHESSGLVIKAEHGIHIPNEIGLTNNTTFDITGHILLSGNEVFPSPLIHPGSTVTEKMDGGFFLSIVDDNIIAGAIITKRNLRTPPFAVKDKDRIEINGSKWKGYTFSRY